MVLRERLTLPAEGRPSDFKDKDTDEWVGGWAVGLGGRGRGGGQRPASCRRGCFLGLVVS